jgi:hypothetical protein
MRTVVGLYDAREDARDTIENLFEAGFPRERISMATQHKGRKVREEERDRRADPPVGEEALGGLSNLLIGLGTVSLPALGVIVAAGPLAGVLTGGSNGGLVGGLVELGIPREEAEIYAEGVRRGATLILVQSDENQLNEARALMGRHHPIDIDRRSKDWRERGWQGYDNDGRPLDEREVEQEQEIGPGAHERTAEDVRADDVRADDVRAEDVRADDVRADDRHGIRVRTYEVSQPVEEKVQLHHEHIDVEHIELDRDIGKAGFALESGEEEVIELHETEEEVIIEKRPRVVGQVRIIKDVDAETEIIRENARRREVDVDRIEGTEDVVVADQPERRDNRMDSDPDYEAYEKEFLRHYERHLAENGHGFSFYRPAYIYGCRLARREQARDRGWREIEAEARRRWLEANPDTSWMEVDSAVHESYRRCQSSSA